MTTNGAVDGIDYLYVETHQWDDASSFWKALGFAFVSQWGETGHRAGRLECGSAAVVLAEVATEQEPVSRVFFKLGDTSAFADPAIQIVSPLQDTHWGTRVMEVLDPDGNVYALQEGGH